MTRLSVFTAILVGILTVAGCQSVPKKQPEQPQKNYAWARKDGQRMTGNPALAEQGKTDLTECRAEAGGGSASTQDTVASTRLEACMDARGYRLTELSPGETVAQSDALGQ